MSVLQNPLVPPKSDLDGLQSAMRDVQVSVADYYRECARTVDEDELGTRVRTCVSFIQVVHDQLRKHGSMGAAYQDLFRQPAEPGSELLQGFEYARHVVQHILHPIRPDPSAMVGGFTVGMRVYAQWKPIPPSVHGRLKRPTQQLHPFYDQELAGHEVTSTLLDAAAFFARVCPAAIHRDHNGEWTGFPLRHQPGVRDRLHPEEPSEENDALAWMSSRRPGGDRRVIVGSFDSSEAGPIVFGLTFTQRCAFMPFFETPAQIRSDIGLGYPYHVGDISAHTTESRQHFRFPDPNRSVLCRDDEIESWAGNPLADVPDVPSGSGPQEDWWRRLWTLESSSLLPGFLTRRERRLNANLPD
jgi:hypothetical protein